MNTDRLEWSPWRVAGLIVVLLIVCCLGSYLLIINPASTRNQMQVPATPSGITTTSQISVTQPTVTPTPFTYVDPIALCEAREGVEMAGGAYNYETGELLCTPMFVEVTATPGAVTVETPQPVVPLCSSYAESADQVFRVRGEFPMYSDMRATVRHGGDSAEFVVYFDESFPSVTMLRSVPDDQLIEAVYVPASGLPIEITQLLEVTYVSSTTVTMPEWPYMVARGVDPSGLEELPQNVKTLHLGEVEVGSCIRFVVRDDEDLQVNRGLLVSLSSDTDPFTIDLQGNHVPNPTFRLDPVPTSMPTPTPVPSGGSST